MLLTRVLISGGKGRNHSFCSAGLKATLPIDVYFLL